MTRRSKLFLFTSPLFLATYGVAQFGFPSVVIDPTAIAKIATETGEVIKVATSAAATYTQLQMDARFITNKSIWKGAVLQSVNSFFNSTPVTDQWARTALTGIGAAGAYGTASVTLESNPRMIVTGSPFSVHYATAQIGVASGAQALQALGNASTFSAQMTQPIQNCQDSALNTDASVNTTPGQLGVQNGCTALIVRQNQAGLQLDAARLQLELFQVKASADNFAEVANIVTGFDRTIANTSMLPGNMAQTITSYPDR